MTDADLTVVWDDHGREPKNAPDPAYPHGKDVFVGPGGTAACSIALPYPAPRCGLWIVRCGKCGMSIGVTAAGRPDDPRSVRIPCKLGATGEFPDGRLDDTDEGELQIAISSGQGVVRIDFGKKVAWLALPPASARALADNLTRRAEEL
jgi:hypothetical protein